MIPAPITKAPITIATAQSYIAQDVRENGVEIRKLMTQAKEQGARLINFPEGAMSGYVQAQIKDWQDVNWEALREELELTRQLAAELNLWVALGCNHQLSEPHKPHNSIYIISDTGDVHTRYDKQWCSYNETHNWYTPGKHLTTFEVDDWKFGCAICVEIQFPELFLAYGAEQIDCLLYSVYRNDTMFGIQAQAYAATNNFWFSLSNASQESSGLASKMIGPSGYIQTSCQPDTSTLCISTLDMSEPSYDVALHKAKPWREIVRNTDFYKSSNITDERSSNLQSF